jgi:methionine synthase II (cobalamin-independent)
MIHMVITVAKRSTMTTHRMLRVKQSEHTAMHKTTKITDPLLYSRFVFNESDPRRSKLESDLKSAYRWTAIHEVMVQFQA